MPKNKPRNPIAAIDELAVMVQKGFEDMGSRIEHVKKSNRAILAVVSELPSAEAFDRMQTKLLDLDHRVHALEQKQ